ncbi:hypothetical protein INR49_011389, partial [Caranx melampygus]
MSIAQAAAKAMLSDALLQHGPGINRINHLELELPLDKGGEPLGNDRRVQSMDSSGQTICGPQISCFPPSNFTVKQASYVDTYCWDSLMHHEFDSDGNFEERSLWVHKMFPYSLLAMAVLMYLPALIWRQLVMPSLGSDLLFIIDELDKSYNRSIRLAQSILDMRQTTKNPLTFQAELQRAKKKRYFEYPLLERYMQCKQNSYFLVSMLFLRGFLLLTFMTAACLYLAYFHLSAFLQDEFSCFVRTGMLRDQNWVPELVQCKMIGQLVFQVISVANGAIYVLLAPIVLFSLIRLFVWDTTFISVYEVLPALDLLNRRRLSCPLNDLNVLLLFLRANVAHLKSYGNVRALCSLAPPQVGNATAGQGLNAMLTQEEMEEREEAAMELAEEVEEAKEEGKLNLVDIMTILGAAQGRVVNCSEKRPLVEQNMSLGTVTLIYTLKRFLLRGLTVLLLLPALIGAASEDLNLPIQELRGSWVPIGAALVGLAPSSGRKVEPKREGHKTQQHSIQVGKQQKKDQLDQVSQLIMEVIAETLGRKKLLQSSETGLYQSSVLAHIIIPAFTTVQNASIDQQLAL